MTESPVVAIKILKEIPLDGEGDTLYNRLRKVKLRGFPEVSIYETSQFEAIFLIQIKLLMTSIHHNSESIEHI